MLFLLVLTSYTDMVAAQAVSIHKDNMQSCDGCYTTVVSVPVTHNNNANIQIFSKYNIYHVHSKAQSSLLKG